jgi:hypothetical protein
MSRPQSRSCSSIERARSRAGGGLLKLSPSLKVALPGRAAAPGSSIQKYAYFYISPAQAANAISLRVRGLEAPRLAHPAPPSGQSVRLQGLPHHGPNGRRVHSANGQCETLKLSLGLWLRRCCIGRPFSFFYRRNVESRLLTRFDSLPVHDLTGCLDLLIRKLFELARAVGTNFNRIYLFYCQP